MAHTTRRDFFKTTLAGTLLSGVGGAALADTAKRSATDWVTLGRTNVKVTRLALGTGTFGGRVQRELGQEQFTRLVRYAYDHGIRFFETAEAYRGMPEMLGIALQGLPRDTYRLMTKYSAMGSGADPAAKLDLYRTQLKTDYIDILLMHCMRQPTWAADYQAIEDGLSAAKDKKVIMAHGASVHGLPALRAFPGKDWLDVCLFRMNHNGTRMDTEGTRDINAPGNVDEVVAHAKKVHAEGKGVLGMKLCGEGQFTKAEDRDAAMKFVMNLGCVDAVTIGFKSTAEIDEAIDRMARVMNG